MVTICVDAMGGDSGYEVVLEGIAEALEEDSQLSVLVAGPDNIIAPFCDSHERAMPLVCTEVIEMGEHPATAVRSKKESTIVRGCVSVRHGDADGFFSAGSTGAILVAASLNVGRIKGVKRPALATAIPGATGRKTVMLDMGANADVSNDAIVQFAHMGRAYSKVALGVGAPNVALLSNGEEESKGSEMALDYHRSLKEASDGWFVGNAEGTDLLAGRYDVIVCDGYTGNVAVKTIEGTAKFIVGRVKDATAASKRSAAGALLLKPALKSVAAELSGDEYGGAVLLGLKAPVIIGHGATSALAVKNGALVCARAVRENLVGKIADAVQVAE